MRALARGRDRAGVDRVLVRAVVGRHHDRRPGSRAGAHQHALPRRPQERAAASPSPIDADPGVPRRARRPVASASPTAAGIPPPLIPDGPGVLVPPPLPTSSPPVTPPPLVTPTPVASPGAPRQSTSRRSSAAADHAAAAISSRVRSRKPRPRRAPTPRRARRSAPTTTRCWATSSPATAAQASRGTSTATSTSSTRTATLVGDHAHYDGERYIDVTGNTYPDQNRAGDATIPPTRSASTRAPSTRPDQRPRRDDRRRRRRPPALQRAEHGDRPQRRRRTATRASFTTCENPHGGYHIEAKTIDIKPGDSAIARAAVLFLGPLAMFYLPVLVIPLRHEPVTPRRRADFVPLIGY